MAIGNLLLLVACAQILGIHAEKLTVSSGQVTILVDSLSGEIDGPMYLQPKDDLARTENVRGFTQIGRGSLLVSGTASRCKDQPEAVCATRMFNVGDGRMVFAADTFAPSADTGIITWKTEIQSDNASCFSEDLLNVFQFASENNNNVSSFWVPRAGRMPPGDDWADVLQPLTDKGGQVTAQLGDGYLYDVSAATRDIMPFALAVFALRDSQDDSGAAVAVMQSADDVTLAATMDVDFTGATYRRLYHRLGCNTTKLTFTTYIAPLIAGEEGGWRAALGVFRELHQTLFSPVVSTDTTDRMGLGAYTCGGVDVLDVKQARDFGLTHVWDAHFWWPYIGQYLPPVNGSDMWTTNKGIGEQTSCGRFSHGEEVNTSTLLNHYTTMRDAGLTVLPYFNMFEMGQNVQWPLPPPASTPSPNDWLNASHFIADHLDHAAILDSGGHPFFTWQNAIVLDAGDKAMAAHLVAQAQRHVDDFGDGLAGLAVDRSDHAAKYNKAADDGFSWCGTTCRGQLPAFLDVSRRVGQTLRQGDGATSQRVMTLNFNGACRVDMLRDYDAVFTENDKLHEAFKNVLALSTLSMPGLEWTYSADQIFASKSGPDAWFQQRLYLNVFPFAPVYGADHSISAANATANALYAAYAPLFAVARGVRWWLVPDAVVVVAPQTTGRPVVNAFLPNAKASECIVIAVMLGAPSLDTATVAIAPTPFRASSCNVVHPGRDGTVAVHAALGDDRSHVTVPLVRGCAMVKCCAD